ncbi:MAG TPA: hypothetical protein VGR08_04760, partial [Thermomicrobiales bacterium]|nr:hypothetical protein [Thermomicrobiales bacterium]
MSGEKSQQRTGVVDGNRLNPEEPPSDRAALSEHISPSNARQSVAAGSLREGESKAVDDDDSAWTIEVGADVIGTCGHKVGDVVAVRDDHIVVEKGFFMPTDFYIPKSAIQKNDDHGLYLN